MKEGQNLVIVESPGKIKKIQAALGSDYIVKASIGHIRDLDESGLSIDVENGFKPEYVIPADKKKVVADLRKAAGNAKAVWLASLPTAREKPSHGTCSKHWDSRRRTPDASYSRKSPSLQSSTP